MNPLSNWENTINFTKTDGNFQQKPDYCIPASIYFALRYFGVISHTQDDLVNLCNKYKFKGGESGFLYYKEILENEDMLPNGWCVDYDPGARCYSQDIDKRDSFVRKIRGHIDRDELTLISLNNIPKAHINPVGGYHDNILICFEPGNRAIWKRDTVTEDFAYDLLFFHQ